MAYVAYSNSPIHVRETAGAVDPGYGHPGSERPDNSLPGGLPPIGSTLPEPPPGVWPPPSFNHPWAPIPPDATTKPPPGAVWPPLGEDLPDGEFWIVAGIPGVGWRYICVDLTLNVDNALPGGRPARPSNRPPGSSPGHPSGQPVPPVATPTR
jgi:hypothetical protein